ncbi:MAG: flagellar hook-length control protein FliK [Pseudobutyrivibrio sp.]|nr:flagellar hook-length control protein FliK [Pseudobutyrivibrio sp.]
MENEEMKPQQNIQTDINKPLEMKSQVDDNNNSSKQEFDFSKNAKTADDTFKVTHEAPKAHEGVVFGQQEAPIEFSVEQEVVTLPTGETVRAESIVNQLVEQAKVLTDAESTTMEMTLNPEGLGKIFMEVTQKGDVITARIFTENDAVKQALENQMATLRTELNQNSTKVTSIEVSVGAHEFERNLEQNARDESRREEQMSKQSSKRNSRINLNSLDELSGIMSEEDMLIAQMMRDNGNTLDFQA